MKCERRNILRTAAVMTLVLACLSCERKQPTGAQTPAAPSSEKQDRDELLKEIEKLKSHIAQIQGKLEVEYQKTDELNQKVYNLTSQSGELNRVKAELDRLKPRIEKERNAADQVRKQNTDLNAQIAELTERLKAFQHSELAIRTWAVWSTETPPSRGGFLIPHSSRSDPSSSWKWIESRSHEIPLTHPSFAGTLLYATAPAPGALEITATEPPTLWLDHNKVPPRSATAGPKSGDAKPEQTFRYLLDFEKGYHVLLLHMPLDPRRPYFTAVLTDDRGRKLHAVQTLTTPEDWEKFERRPRPRIDQLIPDSDQTIPVPSKFTLPDHLLRLVETSDLAAGRSARRELIAKGILAYPVPLHTARSANLLWIPKGEDRFDRAEVGPEWKGKSGTWIIHDGALCCRTAREGVIQEGMIGSTIPLSGDLRLEYDAVLIEGNCDLSSYILGSDANAYRDGYFMGFGSTDNVHSKIRRLNIEILLNLEFKIVKGQKHHVIVERIESVVRMFVDGTLALYYDDPEPLSDGTAWGLYTWGTHAHFDNVKIYSAVRVPSPESDLLQRVVLKASPEDLKGKEGQPGLWQPLTHDRFEDNQIGPNWQPGKGTWKTEDGSLCGSEPSDQALAVFRQDLPGNIRIEYEATMIEGERQSDLSVFFHGSAGKYHEDGYFLGFGSNRNTKSKILKRGEEIAVNTTARHTPGKRHQISAEYVEGILRMWIDGEPALQARDPLPVEGPDHTKLGLYTFGAHAHFDNVRVYGMSSPSQVTMADRLIQHGGKTVAPQKARELLGRMISPNPDSKGLADTLLSAQEAGPGLIYRLQSVASSEDAELKTLAVQWMHHVIRKPGALTEWESLWEQNKKAISE